MIIEVLTRLIADIFELEPDEFDENTDIYDELGADSLDMVELAYACEEEFDTEIPNDKKLWKLRTIAEIAEYIEAHIDAEM